MTTSTPFPLRSCVVTKVVTVPHGERCPSCLSLAFPLYRVWSVVFSSLCALACTVMSSDEASCDNAECLVSHGVVSSVPPLAGGLLSPIGISYIARLSLPSAPVPGALACTLTSCHYFQVQEAQQWGITWSESFGWHVGCSERGHAPRTATDDV